MMYAEALKKLRKPAKTDFIGKKSEAAPKRSGLIPSRNTQELAEPEDPMEVYRQFADVFRTQAENLRGKNKTQVQQLVQELESKRRTPQTEEAPVETKEKKKIESPLEEGEQSRESPIDAAISVSSRDWLGIIDKTEGGGNYSTLFGHSQSAGGRFSGVDVSRMTIGQLKEFSDPNGAYGKWVESQVGRVATPMGRYQFVGSTLSTVAAQMGLSDDTVFDRKTQDAMFEFYLRKRLAQGSTMNEKIEQVRQAWEGFKNVPAQELARLIRNTDENGFA